MKNDSTSSPDHLCTAVVKSALAAERLIDCLCVWIGLFESCTISIGSSFVCFNPSNHSIDHQCFEVVFYLVFTGLVWVGDDYDKVTLTQWTQSVSLIVLPFSTSILVRWIPTGRFPIVNNNSSSSSGLLCHHITISTTNFFSFGNVFCTTDQSLSIADWLLQPPPPLFSRLIISLQIIIRLIAVLDCRSFFSTTTLLMAAVHCHFWASVGVFSPTTSAVHCSPLIDLRFNLSFFSRQSWVNECSSKKQHSRKKLVWVGWLTGKIYNPVRWSHTLTHCWPRWQ